MNILLADDHPMTLEGYISILNIPNYNFIKALTCEEVYINVLKDKIVDIAIIDHDMPAFPERGLENGVDCALFIRKCLPECKIILITAHEEAMLLYNIHKKIDLYGLIVKSDFTADVFKKLVSESSHEESYYSYQVKEALKEVNKRTTLLNSKNREILFYLTQGFKISEIESFVSLSTSGIQKRISKMLEEFDVSDYQKLIKIVKREKLI